MCLINNLRQLFRLKSGALKHVNLISSGMRVAKSAKHQATHWAKEGTDAKCNNGIAEEAFASAR